VNNVDELVAEFAECVIKQSEMIEIGDHKGGNRFAKRYVKAFEQLRGFGTRGRDALKALFQDTRAEVRVMAASYLLRHCENEARKLLEDEAKGVGLTSFGAKQALLRWSDGTWDLDPSE